jgi:hypothetical protein
MVSRAPRLVLMIHGLTPQVPQLRPCDWPLFWVSVIAAAGTVGAVIVTLILAFLAWNGERRNQKKAEVDQRLRDVHTEDERRQEQALELHPGVMWWLVRKHDPAVTIESAGRLRLTDADSQPHRKTSPFLNNETLSVGTYYGYGIGLRLATMPRCIGLERTARATPMVSG